MLQVLDRASDCNRCCDWCDANEVGRHEANCIGSPDLTGWFYYPSVELDVFVNPDDASVIFVAERGALRHIPIAAE
jgi:hypothetical protein